MFKKDIIQVLVIDDDQDDLFILTDLLGEVHDQNFQFEWASSYEKGKFALSHKTHDVCFLDYRLGPQTGLDLLNEVINDDCKIPIILLTGYGEHEVDLEAMRVGAADYLVKDQITSTLLERSIRYSVHRAQSLENRKQMEAQILMQDRLASVGLLASSLAHEIGTPLGVIRGRAEYLAIQTQGDPQIKKNVDIIVSQIDRVTHLIRSLLNLARGDQIRQSGEVNLSQIVIEVLDLMGHELRKQSIEIQNLLQTELPIQVRAESQPLHQVILNLLVNSVHAIESAILLGRTTSHFIRISADDLETHTVLSIEDSGCGISNKNLKNLFKPFFTTKEIGFGTGLGLATSYRIVESWGASIQVASQEGMGTTFKISFPKK
jgi:two-component system sensor histidine kinase/response regulator